jgi:hypothetical protein
MQIYFFMEYCLQFILRSSSPLYSIYLLVEEKFWKITTFFLVVLLAPSPYPPSLSLPCTGTFPFISLAPSSLCVAGTDCLL